MRSACISCMEAALFASAGAVGIGASGMAGLSGLKSFFVTAWRKGS